MKHAVAIPRFHNRFVPFLRNKGRRRRTDIAEEPGHVIAQLAGVPQPQWWRHGTCPAQWFHCPSATIVLQTPVKPASAGNRPICMDANSDPTSGGDPECLVHLQAAAARLRDALESSSFPSLDSPASDQDVLTRVRDARAWWDRVEAVHGSGAGFGSASKIIRSIPIEKRSVLWHFDPYFQGAQPRSAFNPRVADILGHLPTRFWTLPSPFYSRTVLFGSADRLPGPDDLPTIPVSKDNWVEVCGILRAGRQLVRGHCEALLNWIAAQVRDVTQAALPTLRAVGRGSHNAVMIRVSIAGKHREVAITHSQHQFLLNLQIKGHAEWARSQRPDLVRRLPELEAWLDTNPDLPRSDRERNAVYTLPESVRDRMNLGLESTL